MLDENGVWKTTVAPDGRELVTIGTPEFPAEMWGPWNFEGGTGKVPWHWHEELELNMTIWGTEQVTADFYWNRGRACLSIRVCCTVPSRVRGTIPSIMIRWCSTRRWWAGRPAVCSGRNI